MRARLPLKYSKLRVLSGYAIDDAHGNRIGWLEEEEDANDILRAVNNFEELLAAAKLVLEVVPDRLRTEGFRLATLKVAVAKAEVP